MLSLLILNFDNKTRITGKYGIFNRLHFFKYQKHCQERKETSIEVFLEEDTKFHVFLHLFCHQSFISLETHLNIFQSIQNVITAIWLNQLPHLSLIQTQH